MKDIPELIKKYITSSEYRSALGLPGEVTESYELLAQGEYNINYLFTHPTTKRKLVLRVNMGSQMQLDRQIEYESHALGLLEGSGRTPRVLYTDGSKDHGILVMKFLPGDHPRYADAAEMDAVMECLADIHAVHIPETEAVYGEPFEVPRDTIKLIAPSDPAAAILDECELMIKTYMDSPLGDEKTKLRLRRLLDRAHEIAEEEPPASGKGAVPERAPADESGSAENRRQNGGSSYRCCINTELNSTNFLIEYRREAFARLVDWEKPLYGDPAQDLGHLLAPTTTFWKTDDILSAAECERLIDVYIRAVDGRFSTEGIRERTRRLINITCLRGLTWCAMAWVQYKDPDKAIANESTRVKLDAYLSDAFLTEIESRLL